MLQQNSSEMRAHPEYSEKDWVDCLDDAIATLNLCKSLTALLNASSLRFRNKVELDLIQGDR
jgi:hypothetical protein